MFRTEQGVIKPITYIGIIKDNRLLIIDYKEAPNPIREGWWIPAPPLEYGQSPEDGALQVLKSLGIEDGRPELKDVESFVTSNGWHLIFHYVAHITEEIKPNSNIKSYKWVSSNDLPEAQTFAHGQWERALARFFLES